MIVNKYKISSTLLYWIFFLSFFGYYSILIISLSLGIQDTRVLTMPLRLIIVTLIGSLFLFRARNYSLNKYVVIYFLFTALYGVMLMRELLLGSLDAYYLSVDEIIKFYITFSFIPFVFIANYRMSVGEVSKISNSFLVSGLVFASAVIYFYSKYIGTVSRLASNFVEEQVVSPLILSYCSALIIGIFLCNLVFKNYSTNKRKYLYIIGIVLSAVPFLLGASRGALIALFLSVLVVLFFGAKGRAKIRRFILTVIIGILFVFIDNYFSSGILDRFTTMSTDSQDENSRSFIWKNALDQFFNYPIFGDKLKINNWDGYAHNVFIEVLYTMGVIGAIPFFYLITGGFKISISILKYNKKMAWIAVLFLQSVIQFSFSGNLYIAAWLWLSLAFLISVRNNHKEVIR